MADEGFARRRAQVAGCCRSGLVKPRRAMSKAVSELETRMLVYSVQFHSESGAHVRRLESWRHWAQRTGSSDKRIKLLGRQRCTGAGDVFAQRAVWRQRAPGMANERAGSKGLTCREQGPKCSVSPGSCCLVQQASRRTLASFSDRNKNAEPSRKDRPG